jgi:Sds3-like
VQRHAFHQQLAREEHKLLENTIRKRLIARLTQRRHQLLREKEQLDIGETNALSLNTNQFAFASPSSPGSGTKRATRNTGRRAQNNDDTDGRKRKPANDEGENQSPAPPTLQFDISGKDARSKAISNQFDTPAYSLERLFTATELALTMDKAAEAATKFFAQRHNKAATGDPADETSRDGAEKSNEASNEDEDEESAPDMERTVSQSMHQTRGATRNAAAQVESPAPPKDMPGRTTLPTFIPVVIGAKSAAGPATPPALMLADIEADMALFRREFAEPALIKRALQPVNSQEYQYRAIPAIPVQVTEENGAVGSVAMSTQTSNAGNSEHDAPMSRQESAAGGVGMKRSASNAEHLGVPDGRRVRSRVG